MYTNEEINAMSIEEVNALNQKLGKKLLKRTALHAAITVAAVIGVGILARKWENSIDENN